MAVFLNRNKRPQAAPIEVAELLSEKPPLPPESPHSYLFRREREGGGFSTEKPPPSLNLTHPCAIRERIGRRRGERIGERG